MHNAKLAHHITLENTEPREMTYDAIEKTFTSVGLGRVAASVQLME